MTDKNQYKKPVVIPATEINPETDPANLPEPSLPLEDVLDSIPEEDLLETPPYEAPEPGEGP